MNFLCNLHSDSNLLTHLSNVTWGKGRIFWKEMSHLEMTRAYSYMYAQRRNLSYFSSMDVPTDSSQAGTGLNPGGDTPVPATWLGDKAFEGSDSRGSWPRTPLYWKVYCSSFPGLPTYTFKPFTQFSGLEHVFRYGAHGKK